MVSASGNDSKEFQNLKNSGEWSVTHVAYPEEYIQSVIQAHVHAMTLAKMILFIYTTLLKISTKYHSFYLKGVCLQYYMSYPKQF